MTECAIFISYARENRAHAAALAAAFEVREWPVWWDHKIPLGSSFDEVIEEELGRACCIVVLWTKHSCTSRWVKAEAEVGHERGVLIPALLENTRIPIAFRGIETAQLQQWAKQPSEQTELARLCERVAQYAGPARPATAAAPASARDHRRASGWQRNWLIATAGLAALAGLAFTGTRLVQSNRHEEAEQTSSALTSGDLVQAGKPAQTAAGRDAPAAEASRSATPPPYAAKERSLMKAPCQLTSMNGWWYVQCSCAGREQYHRLSVPSSEKQDSAAVRAATADYYHNGSRCP